MVEACSSCFTALLRYPYNTWHSRHARKGDTRDGGGRPEGARTQPIISCGTEPTNRGKQIKNGSLAFLHGEEELSWPVQKPDQKLSWPVTEPGWKRTLEKCVARGAHRCHLAGKFRKPLYPMSEGGRWGEGVWRQPNLQSS